VVHAHSLGHLFEQFDPELFLPPNTNPAATPSIPQARPLLPLLAYCLSITLRQQLKALSGGLMPRVVFEKLATVHLLDVRVPTTDGRQLFAGAPHRTDRDVQLLLARLNLSLPPQPPPCISSTPKPN
jgi:hypothetical protein